MRFVSHLQAVIGRAHGLSFTDTAQLLTEVQRAIPSGLEGSAHKVVQALLLSTACHVESLNASCPTSAAFARRLLSLCEARTGDSLRRQFCAYLESAVEAGERCSGGRARLFGASTVPSDPRVAAMVALVRRQYARGSLDVTEAAASVRLSKWHAARLLHRDTGRTFRDLLLHVRMEEARRQLHGGFLTVKEIAGAVGYSSVAAFSRQFKRSSGMSPKKWRSGRPG